MGVRQAISLLKELGFEACSLGYKYFVPYGTSMLLHSGGVLISACFSLRSCAREIQRLKSTVQWHYKAEAYRTFSGVNQWTFQSQSTESNSPTLFCWAPGPRVPT